MSHLTGQNLEQPQLNNQSLSTPQISTEELKLIYVEELSQAYKYRTNRKFKEAKQSFDKYIETKDSYIRLRYTEDYQFLLGSQRFTAPAMFTPVSQLTIQDMVKFKSEIKHIEENQSFSNLDRKNPSAEQSQRLIAPSVLHSQLELVSQKISFYNSIGHQKEVSQLAKLLTFSTKSSLFPVPSNCYNNWIQKVNIAKKQGSIKKAIEILKEAINSSKDDTDGSDRSAFYRKLAFFLKQTDKDGNQIISAFDKAVSNSRFEKVEIARERRNTLTELFKVLPIDGHKGLLKYFEDSIKNSTKSRLTRLLIEKATFLKSMGQVSQASKTYAQAVESIPKEDSARRVLMLRQQAYFLVDMGKIAEAIKFMQQGELLNPSNDIARFMRRIEKISNLDISTKNLIKNQISDTSLHYPYGCDTDQYLHLAVKARKAGNITQAIQLLKKGISITEENQFKSQFYEYLAIFLKEVDRDGHQIMRAYDKAISLCQFNKERIIMDRKLALWQLSSNGSTENHKELIKYLDELPKFYKKTKHSDIYLQKANVLQKLGDSNQALKAYTQAIQSLENIQFVRKSEVLKQKACLMKEMGKKQQALATFQQAQQIYKSKNNDKIRFLWSMHKIDQIEKIVEKSQDPNELKTIALLYNSEGDRLKKTTNNIPLIRQKFLQCVKVYDKAIKLLRDFSTVRKFMQDQALAFRNAYNFSEMDENVIENHQDKLLAQMNFIDDYKYLLEKYNAQHNRQLINYNRRFEESSVHGFYQSKYVKQNQLLEKNYTESFSLRSLFEEYEQQKCTHYFIENMIMDLAYKLWDQGRYLESYKVFEKAVFLQHQNLFISEHQGHAVLRKTYQAQKQYKANNFRECLTILKSVSSFPSIQQPLKVPICISKKTDAQTSNSTQTLKQDKQFDAFLQNTQALCMWNIGDYDTAAQIFSHMVIYSGKDVSDFLNKSNPEAQVCQMIMKYNTILYNMGQTNYQKCLKKMKKFEKLMGEGNKIKDSKFYINYATVCFYIAKKLQKQRDQKSVQMYCEFLEQFKKADDISTIPKTHQIFKLLKISVDALKQTFFNEVRNIGEQVIVFRDLCFNDKTTSVVYDQVKDYIKKINLSLSNCFKIKEFGIISDTNKLDSLNTLKQCWDQTCYILYKEVINKSFSGDLLEVRKLIDELRQQMQQITNNQGKSIDKDSLQKLPSVIQEIKENHIDEFQAIIKSKTGDALSQIEKAYEQIRRSLMNGKGQNSNSDQIIARLVNDNLEMKQQNQFFMDLLDDLQAQIDKKAAISLQQNAKQTPEDSNKNIQNQQEPQQNVSQFSSDQLLAMLESGKDDIAKKLQERINDKIKQINEAYQTLKQNIQTLIQNGNHNTSTGINNDEVLNALVSGHQQMKDQNQFFKDMLDQALDQTDNLDAKLQEFQKVIAGLENLTKSTISLYEIQQMLRQFAQKHIYTRITEQSQQLIKKLIGSIEEDKLKQNQLQKTVFQYIQKNIIKLLDYVSSILEPLNDGNVQKYFKRFKDDLLIRDNKIKDLQAMLKDYQANQANGKLSKDIEQQIRKLQQDVKSSKLKLQTISEELKRILDKFTAKADLEDLRRLKEELQSSYHQNDDVANKLQLLSTDTLVGNYHDLLDHLEYLKNYIAVNDKKINILSNKLGTKIVTNFSSILRNDEVKFDKHGKLKFQPQKHQFRMNVESDVKQNKDTLARTNPSLVKRGNKKSSAQSVTKLFRTRPINEKFKVTEVSKVIDKGRKNVEMEGQLNRKINVVIMENQSNFDY